MDLAYEHIRDGIAGLRKEAIGVKAAKARKESIVGCSDHIVYCLLKGETVTWNEHCDNEVNRPPSENIFGAYASTWGKRIEYRRSRFFGFGSTEFFPRGARIPTPNNLIEETSGAYTVVKERLQEYRKRVGWEANFLYAVVQSTAGKFCFDPDSDEYTESVEDFLEKNFYDDEYYRDHHGGTLPSYAPIVSACEHADWCGRFNSWPFIANRNIIKAAKWTDSNNPDSVNPVVVEG